jgi:hypothetical protein
MKYVFYFRYEVNPLLDGIMHEWVKSQNIPKFNHVCIHATKMFLFAKRKLFQSHVAPVSPWRQTCAPKSMEFDLTIYQ